MIYLLYWREVGQKQRQFGILQLRLRRETRRRCRRRARTPAWGWCSSVSARPWPCGSPLGRRAEVCRCTDGPRSWSQTWCRQDRVLVTFLRLLRSNYYYYFRSCCYCFHFRVLSYQFRLLSGHLASFFSVYICSWGSPKTRKGR